MIKSHCIKKTAGMVYCSVHINSDDNLRTEASVISAVRDDRKPHPSDLFPLYLMCHSRFLQRTYIRLRQSQ